MKQAGEIWRAAAVGSRALANGRAPVCWREGLKRAAAQMGALRRSCAWLEPDAGQAPKLRSEPLLGRCLVELVGQSVQREASARETDLPWPAKSSKPPSCEPLGAGAANGQSRRRRDVTCPSDCSKANWREPPDRSDPCSQPDAARVAELPKQADGALLAQYVDERSARGGSPQVARAQAGRTDSARQAVETRRPNIEAIRDRFKTSGRAALSAPQKRRGSQLRVESESSLFETLAQRLIERDRSDLRRASLATSFSEGRLSKHLGAPWSMDLAGPTASADLLHRLAGSDQLRPSINSSPVASALNGDQSDWLSPQARDRQSREVAAQAGRAAACPGAAPELIQSQSEPDESPPAASDEVSYRATDGQRAVGRTPGQIAPPSLAESLPPLAPPQTTTTHALPLASETARRGARDEASAPEDLDALAAKIKLILDEQARRHGIDV